MRIQTLEKWTRSAPQLLRDQLGWHLRGQPSAGAARAAKRIVHEIAVIMPNSEKVKRTDWQDYLVSDDKIESITGYDFFAYLNDDVEEKIESKVYQ